MGIRWLKLAYIYRKREIATLYTQNVRKPIAPQAIGQAIAHNPIALIIPCHRVLSRGGELTGYAGGLDRKAKLLQFEALHKVNIARHCAHELTNAN